MNQIHSWGDLDCLVVNRAGGGEPQAGVVLCHGFGAPGTDLVPIADEMIRLEPILRDMLFLFPCAPIELDPFYDSRAWWMIDMVKIQMLMACGEFRELRNSVPPELNDRRKQIHAVIDGVKQSYSLSADKIVVGGFSQGAMLATDVALHYPQSLAGLIIWSGTLLNEKNWNEAAAVKSAMRVIQSHGQADPILPFLGAEYLRDMLQRHGHDVQFVPFLGGHEIGTKPMLATLQLLKSLITDSASRTDE